MGKHPSVDDLCPYCRKSLTIRWGRALLHPFKARPYLVCDGAPKCEYLRPISRDERAARGL